MKKLIALLLALAMILSLAACGKKEETPAAPSEPEKKLTKSEEAGYTLVEVDLSKADGKLKEILDKGTLVIGTSPDFPPAEFIDMETQEVTGSEMQLAQYIADCLGVELQIETMDFTAVLTAVDTGKIDLGVSGFGYKPDRAQNFELTHGYQGTSEASHHTILVRTEDKDKYKSLEDFNKPEVHMMAQAGSLQQMYCEDQLPNAELELVSTLDQAILNLQTGKIDALASAKSTADNYVANGGGLFYSMLESDVEFDLSMYEQYAGNVMAAKKGETSFVDALNVIIDDIVAKDIYKEWYAAAKEKAGIV